jgi:hypothetical protein
VQPTNTIAELHPCASLQDKIEKQDVSLSFPMLPKKETAEGVGFTFHQGNYSLAIRV